MNVESWVAESSMVIGWLTLALSVLAVGVALVLGSRASGGAHVRWGVTVLGLVLVEGAAVLAALGGGAGLWLTGLGGFSCLVVAVLWWFRDLERRLVTRVDEAAEELARRMAVHRPVADPLPDVTSVVEGFVADGLATGASVYTSADDGLPLKTAVVDALQEFGLAVLDEGPVERASWFQRFWVTVTGPLRAEPLRERLRKLEHAVELEYVGKARAEIDLSKAQAVAVLLQAVGDQENVVVRIGSLIVIKAEGDVAVWTVSELDAAEMERHGALLRDPLSALQYLRELRQGATEIKP